MIAKIVLSLVIVAVACALSGALFPPGNVPRQVTVVVLWFAAGAAVSRIFSV